MLYSQSYKTKAEDFDGEYEFIFSSMTRKLNNDIREIFQYLKIIMK
jgi:hypothetical protein